MPIDTFYGVDISKANLDECTRQCERSALRPFRPILIDPEDPESVPQVVDGPLDAFLSTAVYQHFPSKSYGHRVTRIAGELLRPGGVALIQTRYSEGSRRFRPKKRGYKHNAITLPRTTSRSSGLP